MSVENLQNIGEQMAEKDIKVDDENLEETAALDSVKTKSVVMSDIINKMSGMNHDDITKLADILNQVGHEADKLPAGANASSNKNSINTKGSATAAPIGAVKEDLINIFGEDQTGLTEDFINKTTTLFEAAVNMRIAVLREEMFEEAAVIIDEVVEERVDEITEKLDDYLNETVNTWIQENALQVETGIRQAKVEAFLEDLRGLFEQHNIDIPEESEDVVEALMAENEELKNRLNEQIDRNIENQKLIDEATREQVFDDISEGLAVTQVEKFRTLVEGIDSSDLDEYRSKISVIKEQHFKEVKTSNISVEISSDDSNALAAKPELSGDIGRYHRAISQVAKSSKN